MTRAEASRARARARREFHEQVSNAQVPNMLVGYDPGTDELLSPPAPRSKRALPGVWRLERWMEHGLWVVQLWRDGVWFGTGRGMEFARAVRVARKVAHQTMFDCGVRGAP